MKKQTRKSLSIQLSSFFLVMVIACALIVGASGYLLYRNDIIASNANRALAVAESAVSVIDTEHFLTVLDTGEKDDFYYFVKGMLDEIKIRTGVKYLYVLDGDYTDTMTYFAEGYDPVNNFESEYDLGDEEAVETDGVAVYADEMFETLSTGRSTMTDVYNSGDFGAMVSGFAAITDDSGKAVGVVGVDIGVNEVIAASNAFAFSIILIILVFCAITGIVSIRFINRHVGKPLAALTEASDKMSRGDVNIQFNIQREDEVGLLAASFKCMVDGTVEQAKILSRIAEGDLTMQIVPRGDKDLMSNAISETLQKLNGMFEDIKSSSRQVAYGAEQIADGAQNLATGSTQQAATLEEFSAAISEVLSQSEDNAKRASEAYTESMKTCELMAQSVESMNNLSTFMQEINVSSKRIVQVIKVVDDIAFQTNILALNAAVEAARAGQHGKGFAVVADEVRNLAVKSAQAAKETTDMIESNIKKVGDGSNITARTQEILLSINETASANATAMELINSASARQNQAISEITQGINNLSSVVQENSATAEQSAASAEEMSSQARILNGIVEQFHLRSVQAPITASASGFSLETRHIS